MHNDDLLGFSYRPLELVFPRLVALCLTSAATYLCLHARTRTPACSPQILANRPYHALIGRLGSCPVATHISHRHAGTTVKAPGACGWSSSGAPGGLNDF